MALNNQDFKSLLSTDKSLLASEGAGARNKKKSIEDSRREKYKRIQAAKDRVHNARAREDKAIENAEHAGYRNRAADRRNARGEYSKIADEWKKYATMSVEESKYMGGDIEHTHLVKGLDFQLLEKVRSTLSLRDKQDAAQKVHDEKVQEQKLQIKTMWARKIHDVFCGGLHPHNVNFHAKLAKIEAAIVQGKVFKGNSEAFMKGRMSFHFDLTGNSPVKVVHKVGTNAPPRKGFVFPIHTRVLNKLSSSIPMLQHKKKKHNSSVVNEVSADKGVADDIFEDAGEYVPPEIVVEQSGKKKKKSYFDSTDDLMDSCEVEKEKQMYEDDAEEIDHVKKIKKRKDISNPNFLPDVYTECYPGFDEGVGLSLVVDDDEPAQPVANNRSCMIVETKKKTRYDFPTEDQWLVYQAKEKAKTAAEYAEKNERKRKKKAKPNEAQEWAKISKMLDTKETKNFDSLAAMANLNKAVAPKFI